jgi:hypothetical protein
MLRTVRSYCEAVSNGRTLADVFEHACGEMEELEVEIVFHENGTPAGDDGVVGEAVDVMLCMIDLIHQYKPEITNIEIMDIVVRKCEKWQRLYGKIENE